MSGNNQVTVRINGKEQKEQVSKSVEEKERKQDFQWRLPENEILNKKSLKQVKKPKKKQPNGRAPSLPLRRKKKRVVPVPKKTKRKSKLSKNQWLSGISAIVVGVIMGMLVLSVFTNPPHHKQSQSGQMNQSLQKTNAPSGNHHAGLSAASHLSLNVNVVQGGVFSTGTDGKTAESKLQNKGLAAILDPNGGKVYMYIGVTNNKKQAESLANRYKQKGQDVWVKPFSIQVNKQLDKQTSKALGEAKTAFTQLIQASSASFADGKPSFSKKTISQLQNQLQRLKKSDTGSVNPLVKNLDQACNALENYRSDSSVSELWKAEQSLLNAIVNYEKIGSAKH